MRNIYVSLGSKTVGADFRKTENEISLLIVNLLGLDRKEQTDDG